MPAESSQAAGPAEGRGPGSQSLGLAEKWLMWHGGVCYEDKTGTGDRERGGETTPGEGPAALDHRGMRGEVGALDALRGLMCPEGEALHYLSSRQMVMVQL